MTAIAPNPTQPVVESTGQMTQQFRDWTQQINELDFLVGTGSPEGVITAGQYKLYIDEAVPLSPVQYRKMLPDIGGDITQGWAVI